MLDACQRVTVVWTTKESNMKRTETKTISIEMKAADVIQLIRTNYADCGRIPDNATVTWYNTCVTVKWSAPVGVIEPVAQVAETLPVEDPSKETTKDQPQGSRALCKFVGRYGLQCDLTATTFRDYCQRHVAE